MTVSLEDHKLEGTVLLAIENVNTGNRQRPELAVA